MAELEAEMVIMTEETSLTLLEQAKLKPPKNAKSKVWQYCGFHHKDGVITDKTRVSLYNYI